MRTNTSMLLFLDILISLLESGLELPAALAVVNTQKRTAFYADGIIREMKQGKPFSQSFAAVCSGPLKRNRFTTVYVPLIRAGELTGTVLPVLVFIRDEIQQDTDERKNTLTVLLYPAAIMLCALIGTVFLLTAGIPYLEKSFRVLPETAVYMKDGIRLSLWFLLGAGSLCLFLYYYLEKKEYVPYRIFYVLHFLCSSGITLEKALRHCLGMIREKKGRKALLNVIDGLANGTPLVKACEADTFFDAEILVWLTAAGAGGNSIEAFGKITAWYKKRRTQRHTVLLRFTEPAIIVIAGIYLLILIEHSVLPLLTEFGGM